MFFALLRKRPIDFMYETSPASPSCNISSGVWTTLNRCSVALLTPLSVACAESTTATSSVNGLAYASSVRGSALRRFKRSKKSAASRRENGFTVFRTCPAEAASCFCGRAVCLAKRFIRFLRYKTCCARTSMCSPIWHAHARRADLLQSGAATKSALAAYCLPLSRRRGRDSEYYDSPDVRFPWRLARDAFHGRGRAGSGVGFFGQQQSGQKARRIGAAQVRTPR